MKPVDLSQEEPSCINSGNQRLSRPHLKFFQLSKPLRKGYHRSNQSVGLPVRSKSHTKILRPTESQSKPVPTEKKSVKAAIKHKKCQKKSQETLQLVRNFFECTLKFYEMPILHPEFANELDFIQNTVKKLSLLEKEAIITILNQLESKKTTLTEELSNQMAKFVGKSTGLYLPFAEHRLGQAISALKTKDIVKISKEGIQQQLTLALLVLINTCSNDYSLVWGKNRTRQYDVCRQYLTNPGFIIQSIKRLPETIRLGKLDAISAKRARKLIMKNKSEKAELYILLEEVLKVNDLYHFLLKKQKIKKITDQNYLEMPRQPSKYEGKVLEQVIIDPHNAVILSSFPLRITDEVIPQVCQQSCTSQSDSNANLTESDPLSFASNPSEFTKLDISKDSFESMIKFNESLLKATDSGFKINQDNSWQDLENETKDPAVIKTSTQFQFNEQSENNQFIELISINNPITRNVFTTQRSNIKSTQDTAGVSKQLFSEISPRLVENPGQKMRKELNILDNFSSSYEKNLQQLKQESELLKFQRELFEKERAEFERAKIDFRIQKQMLEQEKIRFKSLHNDFVQDYTSDSASYDFTRQEIRTPVILTINHSPSFDSLESEQRVCRKLTTLRQSDSRRSNSVSVIHKPIQKSVRQSRTPVEDAIRRKRCALSIDSLRRVDSSMQ